MTFWNKLLLGVGDAVWKLLSLFGKKPAPHPCFQPNGFILRQNPLTDERGTVGNGRNGWGRHGSIERNGCGAVAVYNLLRALDRPIPFSAVVSELEQSGAVVWGGRLGTRPRSLAALLQKQGLSVQRCVVRKAPALSDADGFLLLYLHSHGMHYVSGVREPDGRFTVRNDGVVVPVCWTGDAADYFRAVAEKCRSVELMTVSRPK